MPKYHVHRSTTISATPQDVFERVADYGSWTSWSPWLCAEPEAEVTITEDPASVGSVYSWKGEVVGQGEIEHLRLEPGRLIEDEIRFVKPFKSRSHVSFEFEPAANGTRITWHMRGALPWFLFWMTPMMETFIGMDYERGLKMLKEWMETGTVLSRTKIRGIEPVGPLKVAGVRRSCSMSEIEPSMTSAFAEATQKLSYAQIPVDGDPISVYHRFDMKQQIFDYTSGFVIPLSWPSVPEELSSWSIPQMKAFIVQHTGSYANLGNAWSAAHQHTRYKKLKQSKVGTYEIYRNHPAETPPAELRTDIYMPLR